MRESTSATRARPLGASTRTSSVASARESGGEFMQPGDLRDSSETVQLWRELVRYWAESSRMSVDSARGDLVKNDYGDYSVNKDENDIWSFKNNNSGELAVWNPEQGVWEFVGFS